MLELLRKAAKTWIAKALLILLVGSFAVWGIQSSVFAPSSDAVVTVGDEQVSNSEFQIAFNSALNNMSQRFGTRLTVEQARMFGIEQAVLRQLISGAALDQLASNMKLGLSEARLLQLIQEEPAFKDETGAFNRGLMEQRLYNARIALDDYVKSKQREAVRTQIADALSNGFEPPKTLTDALTKFASERRSIDYIILTEANIDPVQPPSDDVLAKWFEQNKARYKAPEYRKISYVKLEPSDIADPGAIADAQVKEDYEKHLDTYRTPESRTIEQLLFADKASADAAAAKLAAGATFDSLVSEQGKTAVDVLLGDFTRDKLPSKPMADAAFAVTEDGGTTPVTEGLLGPIIMRVTNIRPETVKPLDEVKEDIRKQLALVLANDEIQNVYDRFEDARASGSKLGEAAKQLQLKAVALDAIDASGHDPAGVEIKNIPGGAKLFAEAFKTEQGVEPLPLTLDDGGYVWFEVEGITPERDRTLDEVKEKAIADWTLEQKRQALASKAGEISRDIAGGTKIADVAAKLGIAVETKTALQRSSEDAVLGQTAIIAAFGGPSGFVTNAASADNDAQIVLQVTDVNDTPVTDALDDKSSQIMALANAAGDDILDQLVGELQAEYGVSVNKTLANQLMVR